MTIPVLTHADFVFNVRDRISGACDVRRVAIDRGWATTAGIGCGRYRRPLQELAECIRLMSDLILVQFLLESIVDLVEIVVIDGDPPATRSGNFHHDT